MNGIENEGTLKKSVRGGGWIFADTVFQKGAGLLSFLILARLLTPADFGIISIIFIVPNLLDMLTTIGLEIALIQSKTDPQPYLNSIWTFNILKSFTIFLLVLLFAPLIAVFFHIPDATLIVRLSGLCLLIGSLSNVAQLFFFKDIDFKKIFLRNASGVLAYNIVAVVLAFSYKSYWPLFWGTVAQYIATSIATYWLHGFRPRLDFHFAHLKHLIKYSRWIYGQNLVNRLVPTIQNSFIAKMAGASDVGLFNKGISLALAPISPFFNVISRVTFPAYARIQDSHHKIKEGFIRSLDLIFFVTIPFSIMVLEASHRIVLIALGPNWIGIDPLLKILTLNVSAGALTIIAIPLLNAIGKPNIQFVLGLINILTLALLLLLLMPFYGIVGAAWALLINSSVISILSTIPLMRILKISLTEILEPILVPLASSIAVLAVGRVVLKSFEPLSNSGFVLLIATLGIVYVGLIFLSGKLINSGPYSTVKTIVRELTGIKI